MAVAYITHPEERAARSVSGNVLGGVVAACGLIPYALVALALRVVMARVFFLSGQTKVVGPTFPLTYQDFSFSVTLPTQVRDETIRAFEAQFAASSIWPTVVAHLVAYAEFILPICLVIGFGTRLSALILLIMTVTLQIYVNPDGLWTTYVYWGSILLVLMTCGPGAISLDRMIRHIYEK
jgi:putative oxidoreductase